MSSTFSKSWLQLSEHIGIFIEYWGFKKVHGKAWTLVFLNELPVDARYLMENLQVSKALISMTLKDLLHYEVIFEVEKDSPGTQKYTYNPDIFNVIKGILENRENQMLKTISEQIQNLKNSKNFEKHGISMNNLQNLDSMTKTAQNILETLTSQRPVPLRILKKALQL